MVGRVNEGRRDRTRVVSWSTGGVGSIAARVLTERPDFDLVGVWVHNPDKVGRDVGEIIGAPLTGGAYDLRPPTFERGPCHDRVLNRKHGQQQGIDDN